jgi:hypothetical protein
MNGRNMQNNTIMIDYNKLAESTQYYETHGFSRIEVPWTVTNTIADITMPSDKKHFKLIHENDKVLIGSGEQGFLYLYAKNFLPKGKFQSITPCFRSDNITGYHTKYFMKNELIITDKVDRQSLDEVISIAYEFFKRYFKDLNKLEVIETDKERSYDIVYDGHELGSYGIRSCDYLKWIYATGIAEPRTTYVMNKFNLL